jgi:hypothetical protein
MHNIKTNFDKILEVIKEIIGSETDSKGNYLHIIVQIKAIVHHRKNIFMVTNYTVFVRLLV